MTDDATAGSQSGEPVHRDGAAGERLEIALVRELEIGFAAGIAPAVVEHARPYQWANACHDLFEAGRIDILEYAARHLHSIYPDVTYLETMVALLDGMPRHSPPPLAFCDEPAVEIQIVERPDCDSVLLCFCAANGTLGLPINFVHRWLGRLPASLVYIKDRRNLAGACGFSTLGPDRASACAALRRIVEELNARRIYTFGVSLGGFPALSYGIELEATAVLSLSGATDYTPGFVGTLGPLSPEYLGLCEQAPDYARDLRQPHMAAPHQPHVLIAYGAGEPRDRQQAERLAGLPKVELVAVDFAKHNVIEPLIRERRLLALLHRLLAKR